MGTNIDDGKEIPQTLVRSAMMDSLDQTKQPEGLVPWARIIAWTFCNKVKVKVEVWHLRAVPLVLLVGRKRLPMLSIWQIA